MAKEPTSPTAAEEELSEPDALLAQTLCFYLFATLQNNNVLLMNCCNQIICLYEQISLLRPLRDEDYLTKIMVWASRTEIQVEKVSAAIGQEKIALEQSIISDSLAALTLLSEEFITRQEDAVIKEKLLIKKAIFLQHLLNFYKDIDQVIEICDKIIALPGIHFSYKKLPYLLRAIRSIKKEKYEQAIADCTKILTNITAKDVKTRVESLRHRAQAYYHQTDLSREPEPWFRLALADFNTALSLPVNNDEGKIELLMDLLTGRAATQLCLNNYEAALNDARQALALNSTNQENKDTAQTIYNALSTRSEILTDKTCASSAPQP